MKNLLTNPTESDIIIRSPQERERAKESESERGSKNFEKSLKNLLTNSKRCDIITKSPERNQSDEVRKAP